jgi:hypothetical protein
MPRLLPAIAAHLLREKYDNALLIEIGTRPVTPSAAPSVAADGAGSIPAGTYKWAFTFVDNAGYESGELSPASSAIVSGSGFKADITIGRGPATVAKRRVYRSPTPHTTWGLVTEINDNTTTAYEDNSASTTTVFAAQYLRYTNWYNGNVTSTIAGASRTFIDAGVAVSGLGQSMQTGLDEARLSVWNLDGAWSNLILQQGALGRRVRIWEQYWDVESPFAVVGYTELFDGRVDEVEFDENGVAFTLSPQVSPWEYRFPGMGFTLTCGLVFKGKWCQYVGAELTCDRTYAACVAYSNEIHFLGFRTLPDTNRKLIVGGSGTQLPTNSGWGATPIQVPW